MQNKEPERGDPSGYAFGVKCSATLSGERHGGAAFQIIGMPRSQSDLVSLWETNLSARKDPARRIMNVLDWYYLSSIRSTMQAGIVTVLPSTVS